MGFLDPTTVALIPKLSCHPCEQMLANMIEKFQQINKLNPISVSKSGKRTSQKESNGFLKLEIETSEFSNRTQLV